MGKCDKMYLHIGKDVSVNLKDIIGIFSIETLKKTKEYEKIIENLKDNIIDISEGKKKTIILTIENNIIKGYISNILSTTLEKRTKKYYLKK